MLRPGTLVAQWEGVELRLGFAPQLIDEQPFVHSLDLAKTILPLLNPVAAGAFKGTVVIDPGHGGEDAGTTSMAGDFYEKDLTADWAHRVKALLVSRGYDVVLTRQSDTSLPLADRVAIAAAKRAGVFISLHFNSSAPNHAESGLETYCLTPSGMPSTLVRGSVDELSNAYPNNAFDGQNLQLAAQVHRALLQVNGHQDRGVRRARFPAVLRGQQCPAVLVEGGYLSNVREARMIADPGYRQKLAEAVARAIEACYTNSTSPDTRTSGVQQLPPTMVTQEKSAPRHE